ncbi:Coagulation factor XIII A chain [Labeo rohita]|uniref:Coagulation factor XIII A chain n=1 Tax=Labeo rohita TaxID=84645 RepID=A0ABQ8LF14_LABRO|nr:Coagulation factor XIII A chain [Labeo rohita]
MSLPSYLAWPWGPQRGRIPIDKSNSDETNPPEFEAFDVMTPRGPTDEETKAAGLSVLSVDMRVTENKKDHNTDKYKSSSLIVRRNKEFTIIIKLDRAFSKEQDDVQMEFLIGSSPDEIKGTYITVSIGKEKREGTWKGRVVDIQGNDVTVGITPDATCIIGRFRTFVTVVTDLGKQRTQRNPDTDFYVLFNPWDPADQVYMEKEEDRQEYVMNDVGSIYNGEFSNIITRSWNFGQMNAQDDDGVLVGNWSGDYSAGTAPTAWTGSPEILLKYASEGCVPVCFAQCWVFAGVLNTFVRCLGIPARVITNYCSAHDNTGNLKTDIVLDEDGRVDRSRTRDSVWNYHCWNEVYMKRLDLPEKYSGWQLNSDVIYHKSNKYGKTKVIYVDTAYVGKLLVTKKKESSEYEDITATYKYPEGSLKEREVMQMAERRGIPTRDYLPLAEAGVDIELQADTIKMGENFKLTLNIKNQTSQTCTINTVITGCVVYYTGVTSTIFKLENKSATVEASKTESVTIDIKGMEYIPHLVEQSNLLFVVYGYIEETQISLTTMKVITLRPPELTIKMIGTPRVGRELMVSVEFMNPYNFTLQKVQLRLDGPGLIPTKLKEYSQILSGGSVKYKVSMVPRTAGKVVLMACLDCALLRQVTNQLEIEIVKE